MLSSLVLTYSDNAKAFDLEKERVYFTGNYERTFSESFRKRQMAFEKKLKVDLELIKLKTGRARLILRFHPFRVGFIHNLSMECPGASFDLLGEDDGFGGYRLYEGSQNYINNKVWGSFTGTKRKASINVSDLESTITNCINNDSTSGGWSWAHSTQQRNLLNEGQTLLTLKRR